MTDDPVFDPPALLPSTLEAEIAAFEAAVVAVVSRGKGAAAARKASQALVVQALQQVLTYVHTLAQPLSPAEAEALVARAGMSVKDARGPTRPLLRVVVGPLATTAHVYARAARTRASYEFQLAPEGGEWVALPAIVRADAPLAGLVPGALYSVRVRVSTKEGLSDFSDTLSFRAG
jgi:hypothetical protein